jgi:hypothetical protein
MQAGAAGDMATQSNTVDGVIEGVPIGGTMQEIDIVGVWVREIDWEIKSYIEDKGKAGEGIVTTVTCSVNGQAYGLSKKADVLIAEVEPLKRRIVFSILRDFVVAKLHPYDRLTRREKLEVFEELWGEYYRYARTQTSPSDWLQAELEKSSIDNYKVDLSDMPLDKNENRIRPGKVINAIIDGKCVKLRENTGVGSIDCVAIWEQLQE